MSVSRCARACARTCVLLAYGGRDTGVHEEDGQTRQEAIVNNLGEGQLWKDQGLHSDFVKFEMPISHPVGCEAAGN